MEDAKRREIEGVRCTDVMNFLKDKENTYDVIFARDVIEHFTKNEVIEILELVFDSLKERGAIII